MSELMTSTLLVACWILAIPAVLSSTYLLALTLLSSQARVKRSSRRQIFFDVVVPAHNESTVITRTVASLKALDWPADFMRIIVVADNCTDDTAELARSAGAHVIERTNENLRGKGYALSYAFQASIRDAKASAVVIVDADAEVSKNLLEAFAVRIEDGEQALQAHYGVLNPMASWRTRLITIAKGSFHIVRSRAREKLGVSCGIRGNGWCVTHSLLQAVPYQAYSLTEDLEYGIDLGMKGYRVAYCDEAHSDADMVTGEQIASKQRSRWEAGRFQLIRSKTLPLLATAIKKRSLICLDLAFDLMVLPLTYVVLNILALILVAIALSWSIGTSNVFLLIGFISFLSVVAYVLRGWQLSGIGWQGIKDFAMVPSFLLWKLLVIVRGRQSSEWVRTDRENL
jgi:cellulose synthase/poly-beta-1,6-N-acetylglucosamine synthase-like glycosyltransferase